MDVNDKDISADFRKDGLCETTVKQTIDTGSAASIDNLSINAALSMQLEVQRQLQEQLEVQKQLQARIEAQSKYLQSILKKAREAFAGYRATSEGLEGPRELTNFATNVSLEGNGASLPKLEFALPDSPELGVSQQDLDAADKSSKSGSARRTANGHVKRRDVDQNHDQEKKRSKTVFCDADDQIWTNEDCGDAKRKEGTIKRFNQAAMNGARDRMGDELPSQNDFGSQTIHVL